MKSLKKLLVSALVFGILSSSAIQAVPTNALVYGGVGAGGFVGLVVTAIVLRFKRKSTANASKGVINDYSPNKIPDLALLKSQNEKAFNEGVSRAKEKIIQCIGKDKCDVLYKFGRRAKIDPSCLKDVDSVIVTDRNKPSVELSGEKLSLFLNSEDEKILGFFLPSSVKAIIDDAFKPIAVGVQSVTQINKCSLTDNWGNGLLFVHSDNGSYSVFVSEDSKSIKIVYENWCKQSCTVILNVQ